MRRCTRCDARFESAGWDCPACGYAPLERMGFRCFAPELAENAAGYAPEYHEAVSHFQDGHFWFRGRNELVCAQLGRYFPDARSLLEVGCGTGQVLRAVRLSRPGMRLCGTEIHPAGLAYARGCLPSEELLQADARNIPFRDEFDVVCAFDVIEHIDDDMGVLRQLHGACRPGGGVMITVPQHRWLWSRIDEVARHVRRYGRAELEAKLCAAGFEMVASTSFVTILLPLMFLSRLRFRARRNCDPEREFRISRAANLLFLACSRAENALIGAGIGLPAGGSLMMLGRKPVRSERTSKDFPPESDLSGTKEGQIWSSCFRSPLER